MGDERFRKSERLRRRREYLAAQRGGKKLQLQDLLVFVQRTDRPRRVGITVSRKVGGAVQRNRVKRRLREAWRRNKQHMPEGVDVVLVAKRSAAAADYAQIERQLMRLARLLAPRDPREETHREGGS